MVTLRVLGLNCGTSVDGIDVIHCKISAVTSSNDVNIEVLGFTEVPVNSDLRAQILRLCRPDTKESATSLAEVCDLNFTLGREFSRAIQVSGFDLDEVDIIASHGQTLWHNPSGENPSTLQMAEPAVIAQSTGRTVVSGFRVAEVAAGRQGAPLTGFFEAALFTDTKVTRIVQNIGGMGNATILPAAAREETANSVGKYYAFDTGPGNVFIDAAVRILTDGKEHYDKDGVLGARGEEEIDEATVEEYLSGEPFFQKEPPKTTGRELFSDDVARSLVEELRSKGKSPEAILATITRITAESIARAYEQFTLPRLAKPANIDEIYICGGGAYNPNILRHIQARFPQSRVLKLDEAPIKVDPAAKEALLFALLGYLGICGRTVPLAADAESTDPAVMGVITPGRNYKTVMETVIREWDTSSGQGGILGRILMS